MRVISTAIEIEAPAERVWRLLTDFSSYPRWNPFIRSVSGEARAGARLKVRVRPPGAGDVTFEPTVLAVEPERELRWQRHLWRPGLGDREHVFTIEQLGPNRVRFVQREVMGGLLAPLLAVGGERTRRGLAAMNRALKERAERLTERERRAA